VNELTEVLIVAATLEKTAIKRTVPVIKIALLTLFLDCVISCESPNFNPYLPSLFYPFVFLFVMPVCRLFLVVHPVLCHPFALRALPGHKHPFAEGGS